MKSSLNLIASNQKEEVFLPLINNPLVMNSPLDNDDKFVMIELPSK
jgi:hypothetical protein